MNAAANALRGALIPEGVQRGFERPAVSAEWRLSTFKGRLGEISGTNAASPLTLAFRLVLEAQQADEPVVWIGGCGSSFFPPDAADAGIDLSILPVVRVPRVQAAVRAADQLVRSGAFSLVVLDLGLEAQLPMPAQTRLMGLAKKHHAALLCLTEKDERRPSLGSLISVRVETKRTERLGDRYRCEVRALKDKRRQPGWTHTEVCRAPDGLC